MRLRIKEIKKVPEITRDGKDWMGRTPLRKWPDDGFNDPNHVDFVGRNPATGKAEMSRLNLGDDNMDIEMPTPLSKLGQRRWDQLMAILDQEESTDVVDAAYEVLKELADEGELLAAVEAPYFAHNVMERAFSKIERRFQS